VKIDAVKAILHLRAWIKFHPHFALPLSDLGASLYDKFAHKPVDHLRAWRSVHGGPTCLQKIREIPLRSVPENSVTFWK